MHYFNRMVKFFTKMCSGLFGSDVNKESAPIAAEPQPSAPPKRENSRQHQQNRNRSRNRNDRGGNNPRHHQRRTETASVEPIEVERDINTQPETEVSTQDNANRPNRRPNNRRGKPQQRRRGRREDLVAQLNDSDEDRTDQEQIPGDIEQLNTQQNLAIESQEMEFSVIAKPESATADRSEGNGTKDEDKKPSRNRRRRRRPDDSQKSDATTLDEGVDDSDLEESMSRDQDEDIGEPSIDTPPRPKRRRTRRRTKPQASPESNDAADGNLDDENSSIDAADTRAEPATTEQAEVIAETSLTPNSANSSQTAPSEELDTSSEVAPADTQVATEEATPLLKEEITETAEIASETNEVSRAPVELAEEIPVTEAVLETAEEPAASYSRAANDPRLAPQPVIQVVVETQSLAFPSGSPLDTALPAAIESNPRPLARAANDPRNQRVIED